MDDTIPQDTPQGQPVRLPRTPGIYRILNAVNGYCYVGSAKSLRDRRDHHLGYLRKGAHHNSHLQRAFTCYGESTFVFEVLELVDEIQLLIPREQYWIDTLDPEYNIRRVAESNLGTFRTKEMRLKMSASQKGRIVSEESRRKMSEAAKNRSEESRRRYSKAHSGRKHTVETRLKMSATRKGKKKSEEWRRKIGLKHKGKVISEETRRKSRESHLGKKVSEETRRKKSIAQKGNPRVIEAAKRRILPERNAKGRFRKRVQRNSEQSSLWDGIL